MPFHYIEQLFASNGTKFSRITFMSAWDALQSRTRAHYRKKGICVDFPSLKVPLFLPGNIWILTNMTCFSKFQMCQSNNTSMNLTFIEYLKATVWSAVVGGEEQIQEVTAAKQELRDLGSIKRSNHRWQQIRTVVNLQEVITELSLKPWKQSRHREGKRRSLFVFQ